MPRLALLLVVSLVITGCRSPGSGDYPAHMTWHGTTYYATVNGLQPAPADLSELGAVDSVVEAPEAPLGGRIAYKLAGVDTAEAVTMALAKGGYMLFKAQPGTPPSPGLCRYVANVPGAGCPAG